MLITKEPGHFQCVFLMQCLLLLIITACSTETTQGQNGNNELEKDNTNIVVRIIDEQPDNSSYIIDEQKFNNPVINTISSESTAIISNTDDVYNAQAIGDEGTVVFVIIENNLTNKIRLSTHRPVPIINVELSIPEEDPIIKRPIEGTIRAFFIKGYGKDATSLTTLNYSYSNNHITLIVDPSIHTISMEPFFSVEMVSLYKNKLPTNATPGSYRYNTFVEGSSHLPYMFTVSKIKHSQSPRLIWGFSNGVRGSWNSNGIEELVIDYFAIKSLS